DDDGQRRRSGVRGDDGGGLTKHHEAGGRSQKEDEPEPPEDVAPTLVRAWCGARLGHDQGDAGSDDEPCARRSGEGKDGGESTKGGAYTEVASRPTEDGRRDHGAERVEAHQVAIDEATVAGDREVHRLLRDEVSRSAPGAEQQSVAEHELTEPGRGRREGHAERA